MKLSKKQKKIAKAAAPFNKITGADFKALRQNDARGRYLPKSVRQSLTPAQKAAENRKKRAATRKGKTHAKYGKEVLKKMRNR